MDGTSGVLILAGGKSERMVFPKSFLLYEGKTFLKKIVEEYVNSGVKNICVVINEEFCKGEYEKYIDEIKSKAIIIKNIDSELGRFHSVKLGLKKMLNLDFCFIQNIDNPFVNKKLIESLMESRNSVGYTSPIYLGRKGHPILVSKKIIQHLNDLPDRNFNLKNILSGFPKSEVEVDNDSILININTPGDYKEHIEEIKLQMPI
jgi:molybdenum cofactor cytidylyltransferase